MSSISPFEAFQVRSFGDGDLGRLEWLDQLTGPQFNWDRTKWRALQHQHDLWVLEGPEGLVACAATLTTPAAHELIMIARAPQGLPGAGRFLLQTVIDAKSHNRPWWLEVHENNQAALQLYRSLGFQEAGRRSRYYSDGAACILMSLPPA